MRKNVHEAYKRAIGFRRRLEIGENTDDDYDDEDCDGEAPSSAELENDDDIPHSFNNINDGDDDDEEEEEVPSPPINRTNSNKNTSCPFVDSTEVGDVCNRHETEANDDCGGDVADNHDAVFT